MRRGFLIVVIACAVLLASLSGCKSAKTPTQEVLPAGKDVFTTLAESYRPWTDVEIPVKLELRQPRKLSLNGTAKMTAGGEILVSFRFFGLEVGNLWLDADSIQVVVKAMDVYFKEGISALTARTSITVADIQALLLGRLFSIGQGTVTPGMAADFKTEVRGEQWKILPRKQVANTTWFFSGDTGPDNTAELKYLTVSPPAVPPIVAVYGAPVETLCGPVATDVTVMAEVKDKTAELTLKWSPDRAKWNRDITLSAPKIPREAKRITVDNLAKILEKL